MATAIWWVRRDVRLSDSPALTAALREADGVIPVFIEDARLMDAAAPKRRSFLLGGLRALDDSLRQRGSRLIVRRGRPEQVLAELMVETGATAVFAEEDYTPFARQRDLLVGARLPLRLLHGLTVHHPLALVKPDGAPFRVFTPFSKLWKALPLPARDARPPEVLPPVGDLLSLALPEVDFPVNFPPGENEANRRLETFLSGGVYVYAEERNRLDLDGTSALSPYLRFGMLSAYQAVQAARKAAEAAPDAAARRGCEVWINELIWREFYQSILYHFPEVLKTAFSPAFRAIPWRDAPDELAAWQQGCTGLPVVDAAMRQLAETGWMHNRGRMIVASFLVKDLLINWQEGERWFMQILVDGDPAANNGGWQWTAGVGTDAAPYFRIFNPVLQGKRFDPHGHYARRWVPELAGVPDAYIHEPWRMPEEIQRQAGCRIGLDYPAPVIEHASARGRALDAFRQSQAAARASGEG